MSLWGQKAHEFYRSLYDLAKEITPAWARHDQYRLAHKGLPHDSAQRPSWVIQQNKGSGWEDVRHSGDISTALVHYLDLVFPDISMGMVATSTMERAACKWAYEQQIVLVSDEANTIRLTFNHLPVSFRDPWVWKVETRATPDEDWTVRAESVNLSGLIGEFLHQHARTKAQGFVLHKGEDET